VTDEGQTWTKEGALPTQTAGFILMSETPLRMKIKNYGNPTVAGGKEIVNVNHTPKKLFVAIVLAKVNISDAVVCKTKKAI
jgi:hypothetical protein